MANYSNVEINIFSLVMLFILFKNMFHRKESNLPDQKFFYILIISDAILLILDSLQWLVDGKTYAPMRYANIIADMFYYMLQTVPCLAWCLYVRYKYTLNLRETMRAAKLLLVPAIINAVLAVMSCFYNVYFYVDDANVYHRGNLFWVFAVIAAIYFVYALAYILKNKNKVEKEIFRSLVLFLVPPLLGGTIQVFIYGASLIWPCVTLSLLIIYINIQDSQLYTDHLTGLNNRRLLDIYLERYMRKTGQVSSIGAIMLDIDNFKQINDKFGHTTGDKALVDTAAMLKLSLDKDSILARYGGDEFVIVKDAKSFNEIEQVVKVIENNMDLYNRKKCAPYFLKLTAGYSIFECGVGLTKNDVLNEIDRIMYENKRSTR